MSVPTRTVIVMKNGASYAVTQDYAAVKAMFNRASPLEHPGMFEFTDGDGEALLLARDEIATVKERAW